MRLVNRVEPGARKNYTRPCQPARPKVHFVIAIVRRNTNRNRKIAPSMRSLLCMVLTALGLSSLAALAAFQGPGPAGAAKPVPGKFVEVTSSLAVRFQYLASH